MLKRALPPLIILFLVSFLLDLYVSEGIRTLAFFTDPPLTQTIQQGYWLISWTALLLLLFFFFRAFPSRKFNRSFKLALNVFLTLFIMRLVFMLVLLAGDIGRILICILHVLKDGHPLMPARPASISWLAALLSLVPFFAFLHGTIFGKYRYKVHRISLYFDDLPEAFDKFTIAQISDIHSGSFDDAAKVQKGIDLLNAQHTDLFVFTGDLVNNRAEEIVPYLDIFSQIKAPYGCFSILGNHDYGDYVAWNGPAEKARNLTALKQYHKEIGFRLLLDEHVWIRKGEQQLALLGVENWGKGFGEKGDLQKALEHTDPQAFKVLLSHDPSHWSEQIRNNPIKIHLTLSGHTHGMQFGIEIGRFKWSPVKYRYPNWAGLAQENERYLYVNRGFGFLGFSGRIGIWPEITIIQLNKRTHH